MYMCVCMCIFISTDMKLKLNTYGKDSFIPYGTAVDLNCVIYPATNIIGTVSFKLHLRPNGFSVMGSATQKDGICTANTNMMVCGNGTQTALSKVKTYSLQIRQMKPEYYMNWTCAQDVFYRESNVVDLEPYSMWKTRIVSMLIFIIYFSYCFSSVWTEESITCSPVGWEKVSPS